MTNTNNPTNREALRKIPAFLEAHEITGKADNLDANYIERIIRYFENEDAADGIVCAASITLGGQAYDGTVTIRRCGQTIVSLNH